MKKIILSVFLLLFGILLMILFSNTDQGQSGLMLGLDAPEEQLAYGWPAFIGWVGMFSLLGAFVLFVVGINQIKEKKREILDSKFQKWSDNGHRDSTSLYMTGNPTDKKRPMTFGRPENHS